MAKRIEDRKKQALLYCRYYNGEEKNPYPDILESHCIKSATNIHEQDEYDIPEEKVDKLRVAAWVYEYEVGYVHRYANELFDISDENRIQEYEHDMKDYHDEDDGTPLVLKTVIYSRYCHWMLGDYVTKEGIESFRRWYNKYYCSKPTHLETRTIQRTIELTSKCKYYNGEKDNPWEYCYAPVLVWRRKIWEIEKQWVTAMAHSYRCKESSRKLVKGLALEEYFRIKGFSTSLINLILTKEQEENEDTVLDAIEAIKISEKYKKWAPLGHDHRMYFAFYLGEEECPYNFDDSEEYKRMGWSQEQLQLQGHIHYDCLFDGEFLQKKYRGQEGVGGWYADPKFPKMQKEVLFFNCCNWGRWCPYSDIDKLAEEYLNYHYPGDYRPKHPEKFYREAALNSIKDERYYRSVHKCGKYKGKRVFRPVFSKEYEGCPMGLPSVILVDDDGNVEHINSEETFDILDAISKHKKDK